MTLYITWACLLVAQNAAFTWVSRARNSGSDWYHALAAVFSNGIWFAATFITFERVWTVLKTGDVALGILIGAVYVVATVLGSVSMGMFLRKYVERGKRKVGHYEDKDAKLEGRLRDMGEVIVSLQQFDQRLMDGAFDAMWAERARLVPPEPEALNMVHPEADRVLAADLQAYVRDRDARARAHDD